MSNLADEYAKDYANSHRKFYERRATRLRYKLKQVPAWQEALAKVDAKVKDPLLDGKIQKAMQLAAENGITFVKPPKNHYAYSGTKYAKYEKGDVKLDLLISGHVDSNGDFHMEGYLANTKHGYSETGDRVMRIFSGTTTRVTNNVLKALLNKNNAQS